MGHIEEQHTGIKNYLFEKFDLVLMSGSKKVNQWGTLKRNTLVLNKIYSKSLSWFLYQMVNP